MFKNKKILAFIPARAGSKRVVNKNKRLFRGKPLFTYSVDVAMKSKYIDKVLVSSDSLEILELAYQMGCIKNSLRPEYLSGDKARIIDAMLYEVEHNNLEFDAIVLLQPTSPFRTVEMLDKAIEKYFETETSLITVLKAKEQPLFMRTIEDGKLTKVINSSSDVRSQDFRDVYKIIGSIYINNLKLIDKNTVLNENEIPFVIDDKFDVDIDTIEDFVKAEKEICI